METQENVKIATEAEFKRHIRLIITNVLNKGIVAAFTLRRDAFRESKISRQGTPFRKRKEAKLMRRFDHPNIVRFYGVAPQEEPIMIILELASGGSLKVQFVTFFTRRSTRRCPSAACARFSTQEAKQ
ncbi:hypothetical protein COOONC_05308 [Cooperia oncophora]